MPKLLIVESPGKVKKLQGFLGSDWVVAASVGHVRDLPQKEIGVTPPDFKPQYVPTERGAEQLAKLAKLAKTAEAVYLATDADREGEGIAWHLYDALKLKKHYRTAFTEISSKAVLAAVKAPRTLDMHLVAAQAGRRVLDRLVGYLASRPLSSATGQPMSAGRVQSPAVRLLVDRERAIRNFKAEPYFEVLLTFGADPASAWTARWDPASLLPSGQQNPRCLDSALAQRVATVRHVTVTSYKETAARRAPPPPFTTSTFQRAAFNRLKLDPDRAMQVAQKLYEQGLITYMRTDSTNLADEAIVEIRAAAQSEGLSSVNPARTWASKAGAQEAHEAIRPVHMTAKTAGSTSEEQAVYELIWQRTLACQLPDATYAVRTALLEGALPSEAGKVAVFKAVGRTLQTKGWLAVTPSDATVDGAAAEPDNPVAQLVQGQSLTADKGEALAKKTKPPARYNAASLVEALETEGIGRPSTYASIIKTIQTHGYVETKQQKLFATPKGELAVDALVAAGMSFVDLGFTRAMEARLDAVAQGKETYLKLVSDFYAQLSQELTQLQPVTTAPGSAVAACPDCGKPMRLVQMPGKTPFLGCTGYPVCRKTLPATEGQASTPKTGAPVKHQAPAAAGTSAATTAGRAATAPCPKCGSSVLLEDKWLVCSGNCGLKIWREVAHKRLTDQEATELLASGKLPKTGGYTGRAGKPFSAALKLNAEGKIDFEF